MRILLLNPNMSASMTDRMVAAAAPALAPDARLAPLTAERGFPYVSSRAEAQVAGLVALEMLSRHACDADAAVIAAFGDPGLRAARELFDIPVVGVAEAAMLSACMLGERFGVVAFTRRMLPWYAESVRDAGLQTRFAGFRCPEREPPSADAAPDALREELLACVRASALEDGADAVIVAGAPLAGLAAVLAEDAPAVLIDPVCAAVGQAQALARLAPLGASKGSFARPAAKDSAGLDPDLARIIARTRRS
jgi:Asp/Glu/hydantoin racemase